MSVGTTQTANKFDLDAIVKDLAKKTERPVEEVQTEIKSLIEKDGFTPMGAVARWKSDNKFKMGETVNYRGRVIGKEAPKARKVGSGAEQKDSKVAGVYFLIDDGKTISLKQTALWGEATAKLDELPLNAAVEFKGREVNGQLKRVTDIKQIPDDQVVAVGKLEERGLQYASLAQILNYVDKTDLFRGWVGKTIPDTKTGQTIGFEFADLSSYPITVWTGAKFGGVTPDVQAVFDKIKVGDEVAVFGYVSASDGEPKLNQKGVFIL